MYQKLPVLILSLFLFGFAQLAVAQGSESQLLETYFYLESGDVYAGDIISETPDSLYVNEVRLGEISLTKSSIKSTVGLYQLSEIMLTLTDQTRYSGTLQALDSAAYVLTVAEGREPIRVLKSQVASLEILQSKDAILHNPNATRYLFAPSAIPLKKGTGYYQNAYILLNSANYGLTDHISVGGGVGIPLFFFVNPKIGTKVAKNFYMAGGAIAATTFIGENITIAIPFAAATYGNEENNATLATGYGMFWFDGDYSHSQYPIGTFNGMFRLSRKLHLITENWVVPFERERYFYDQFGNQTIVKQLETYIAAAVGLRIKVGEKASFDVAPVLLQIEQTLVLPYVDFVYKF